MRNTEPKPGIRERDSDTLVEDLCIALRNVGLAGYDLLSGERVLSDIRLAQAIGGELKARGVDVANRLMALSEETGWLMDILMAECLSFPTTVPYVRDKDGIRWAFRCAGC